ncbi:MAG: symmetrical bis(5'-nucleosyl)-tetraphosphatase [Burkholderiaceae bacterium]|jgi:bis(5'-nucleosyl)-tetraphosphatase (symmetrical)|nr:symmetrical bis(5'-nucleosyl)-tetraphosphatase [Burkholderiaceae bacterium]
MALYLIGDVQGCDQALGRLLDSIAFSPSRDRLVLLGDLVNRGPQSLAVLRRMMALGDAAACLLGNHDLHLLALAQGARTPHHGDTLHDILHAADRDALLDWLRRRPLALQQHGVLMVHAGVLPQWTAAQTLRLAAEVETVLRSADWVVFMHQMYGNQPDQWHDGLQDVARLRLIVNALTRLRFCSADGRMEFVTKDRAADGAPPGYLPWFDVPGRRTAGDVIAFGHWSALGWLNRPDVMGLDTGCVWGGCLSAVRLGANAHEREQIQVRCEQWRAPEGVA